MLTARTRGAVWHGSNHNWSSCIASPTVALTLTSVEQSFKGPTDSSRSPRPAYTDTFLFAELVACMYVVWCVSAGNCQLQCAVLVSWRAVFTSSADMHSALNIQCLGNHDHETCQGNLTRMSENYSWQLADLIATVVTGLNGVVPAVGDVMTDKLMEVGGVDYFFEQTTLRVMRISPTGEHEHNGAWKAIIKQK